MTYSMKCRATLLGIVTVTAFFGTASSVVYAWNQADELKRRFEEEAPKAWEKYKARLLHLQGTILLKQFRLTPERKLETDRKYEFKQKRGHVLFMEQDFRTPLDPDQEGVLRVTNPDYVFELRRSRPDRPWTLTRFTSSAEESLPFHDPSDSLEQWITYPITLSSIYDPLRIVIHEPGYKATDFSAIDFDGHTCIKVQFNYTPDGKNPRIPFVQGYAIYNPDEYWIVRQYNAARGWAVRKDIVASTVVKMQYHELPDGFPVLKRVSQKFDSHSAAGEYHGDWTYEFDLMEGDVPDEVFTLTAYGLPMPKGLLNTRRYWPLGCAAAGLACLAFALLIRRRKTFRSSSV